MQSKLVIRLNACGRSKENILGYHSHDGGSSFHYCLAGPAALHRKGMPREY